jgi:D-sedoheptulose 7-phosphate isomerase
VGPAQNYLARLSETIRKLDADEFDSSIGLVRSAWQSNKQIIVFGNGGSALTALHYVTDWNKAIYLATGKPIRARCLLDNIGLVTAYANDISYDDIFLEQLKAALMPGDLVIGISGSGNSENVLRAIAYANENDGVTLGICGYSGGKLRKLARHSICTNVHDMQLSEDLHLVFGHIVMQTLCAE